MSERSDTYLAEPALHPRLLEPHARATLAEAWKRQGRVRIPEALSPGLAALLAARVRRLPFSHQAEDGVRWCCEIELTSGPESQHPEPYFRLQRFVDRDLPDLIHDVTGLTVTPVHTARVAFSLYRKGSWRCASERTPGVAFHLGLSSDRWPEEWGGHLRFDEATVPPEWDTLHLYRPGALEVPLVLRHVELLATDGLLTPAPVAQDSV